MSMIKQISFTLFLALILHSCSGQKEEALVRKSFDNYKSAVLNDNGEEAVKYVCSRTIEYYSSILLKAKKADSSEVSSLGLMDKLMVFSIRHRATKSEILSFDGEGLLVYAIKEGMVGKNSVANNTVGDVQIDAAFAKGQLLDNGQEGPFYFHFYKEEGIWKIDLTAMFSAGIAAFKTMQEDSGLGENEYLFSLLEMLTGRKPGNDIWEGAE